MLVPVAAVIGVLAGLGAVGFDLIISGAKRFFFTWLPGQWSGTLAHVWGGEAWLILLLPAMGGLAVGLLRWALGGRGVGHGIPNVIEALAKERGRMSMRGALYKAGASALTIGSGGSAGVEGPILQIGATLASQVSALLRMGRQHASTILGCGAAAATAAIFNAPIAGVVFVLEVVLRDFTLKTFVPIVVSAVFGTAVAQAVAADTEAVFSVPDVLQLYEFQLTELVPYAILGVLCGLVGACFAWTLQSAERLNVRVKLPDLVKPALGGLGVGLLGVGYMALAWRVAGQDSPPFFGNGYIVIQQMLNPLTYPAQAAWAGAGLMLALLGLKFLATCLTIGSGGSGGIIAPSLFMGASLGACFAMALQAAGLYGGSTPATFALAGMAGAIAATAHCPLAAFLLVFEVTRDYEVVLPMMLVAIFAMFASQVFGWESIYRSWLRKRGIRFGRFADASLLHRLDVSQVALIAPVTLHPEDPAQRLIDLAEECSVVDYVVVDEHDHYQGMVVGQDVRTTLLQREAIPLMIVGELMRTDLASITPGQRLDVVLDRFAAHDVTSLPVVDAQGQVQGLITRSALMTRYQQALDEEA